MFRRVAVVPALLVSIALVVAACRGGAPALTDPSEILTKSVAAFEGASSVRLTAEVDGTLSTDLTGSGQSTDMSLAGTKLTADLDLKGKNAHVAAQVPAFLGLTADIIIIGSDTWTRISLSGDKYEKSATNATAPTDPAAVIKSVTDFLARPEVRPTKKDDVSCGSKSCYQVEIPLQATDLGTLMPGTSFGDATVVVTLLVEKDTLFPASAVVTIKGTTVGDLKLRLAMTDWNKAVSIAPPSADQVK